MKLSKAQKEVIAAMRKGIRYFDVDRTITSLVIKGLVTIIIGGEARLTDLGRTINID